MRGLGGTCERHVCQKRQRVVGSLQKSFIPPLVCVWLRGPASTALFLPAFPSSPLLSTYCTHVGLHTFYERFGPWRARQRLHSSVRHAHIIEPLDLRRPQCPRTVL